MAYTDELDLKEYRRQKLVEMIGQDVDLGTVNFLTLVHRYPDTDALLCAWGMRLLLCEQGVDKFQVDFVSASAPIDYASYHEQNYTVIAADVGRGEFDQHGKGMRRGSSFERIVDYFRLWDEPGISELVELARATDNVEKVARVSIHYLFKALPRRCRDKNGEIQWLLVLERAFEILDDYREDRSYEAVAQQRLQRKEGVLKRLRNGFVVGQLGRDAGLRQAAYDAGADCCVFFDNSSISTTVKEQNPDAYCAVIQLHNRHSKNPRVKLHRLVAALRFQEAKRRGVEINGFDTTRCEVIPELGAWYLHDSGNVILCGSRSSPIDKVEQLTTLGKEEIYATVRRIMGDIGSTRTTSTPAYKPTLTNKKTSEKTTALGHALRAAEAKLQAAKDAETQPATRRARKTARPVAKRKVVAKKKTPAKKKVAKKVSKPKKQ